MRRLRRVLVANRGEIAVRIVRACRDEGIDAIVAASDADLDSLAARMATDVVRIGPADAASSYLRPEQIVAAALLADCDAVHPGYGFLAERHDLATACSDHGLVFVGPSADTIRRGGDKVEARRLARAAGAPVGGGSGVVADVDAALDAADVVGYPVLLKAAAGGGGRGMVRADDAAELTARFASASNEAAAAFGDGRLYVERFVERARHVEVQLLGDHHGHVVHLGDRDCSVQRRHQKLVEEAPAPGLHPDLRSRIADAALAIGHHLGYRGAGTVEFLVDLERSEFSFLEINTRIQVEHPVTEMVTGCDLVRAQLRVASGEPLGLDQDDVALDGHAVECRVNAESVEHGFLPSPGTITRWNPPDRPHVRVDTHGHAGYDVPPHYDSLLAKVVATGPDRATAIDRLACAVRDFDIGGVDTTLDLHRAVLAHDDFRAGAVTTTWLETVLLPRLEPVSAREAVPARG